MSSPLSTLRKSKRAPLPEIQRDGERKTYKDRSNPDISDYETALFQEIFPENQPASLIIQKNLHKSKISQKMKVSDGMTASAPSDFELMSSMMQKISQLEKRVKTQAVDIEQKARRIAVLEEKLSLLQETKEKCEMNGIEDESLTNLCLKLQKQVWEMEKFLNDYGMIWVGCCKEPEDVCSPATEQANISPGTSVDRGFEMNFDLVIQNVRELNVLAGEGESHVISIPGGAKLTQQSSIPLWLYRNGIIMFNGPFRSYQDPATQECMQDLIDGFFPSELQQRFPNGVPFQVYDKRDEEFIVRRLWTEFPGRGQTIVGAAEQSAEHHEQNIVTPAKPTQIPGTTLSMEQFLRRLPESVVKSGKVINIRDPIKARLQGFPDGAKNQSTTVVETRVLQTMRERETDRSLLRTDITTLRVRSEDGLETFIVKMFFDEIIGDLRCYLDMKRGPGAPPYDIISAFPKRSYSDGTQTLLSCGLTPNAALILRPQVLLTDATGTQRTTCN